MEGTPKGATATIFTARAVLTMRRPSSRPEWPGQVGSAEGAGLDQRPGPFRQKDGILEPRVLEILFEAMSGSLEVCRKES
jgi:hypothetical protein